MAADALNRYAADCRAFVDEAARQGLGDVRDLWWYHTVDLGDGLVTPGLYDLRATLDDYGLPADMHGLSVLDAGAATGFFSFAFARRGARVVALELPSLDALDRFYGQTAEDVIGNLERMTYRPDGELPQGVAARSAWWYRTVIERPFELCRSRLGIPVERRFLAIYDASPATLERAPFDVVYAGDVLLHTLYPMRALAALASVCAGELIVVQRLAGTPDDAPAMAYVGGDDPHADKLNWWLPNFQCLRSHLRKLGFDDVRDLGTSTALHRPLGRAIERTVVRAARAS
ncbi:MAG TPA: hypothetical protein VHT53_02370 [Candidatus Elarobacter sp.]|nr:hypothetical protein [Candidatus Elarobacter sp.]